MKLSFRRTGVVLFLMNNPGQARLVINRKGQLHNVIRDEYLVLFNKPLS
jgi:hypothetical protein